MFESLLLVFTLHNVIEFSVPRLVFIQIQSFVSEKLEQVSQVFHMRLAYEKHIKNK